MTCLGRVEWEVATCRAAGLGADVSVLWAARGGWLRRVCCRMSSLARARRGLWVGSPEFSRAVCRSFTPPLLLTSLPLFLSISLFHFSLSCGGATPCCTAVPAREREGKREGEETEGERDRETERAREEERLERGRRKDPGAQWLLCWLLTA